MVWDISSKIGPQGNVLRSLCPNWVIPSNPHLKIEILPTPLFSKFGRRLTSHLQQQQKRGRGAHILPTYQPSQVFFTNRNATVKLSSINAIHEKQQHNIGFFIFKFTLKYMLGNVNI